MKFNECFEVKIVKAYKKLIRRQTEEGTFMVIVKGKLLNSKTEWHQPKIVRTAIHSDGAELAGGRIVSFPVDGSQRTQENWPIFKLFFHTKKNLNHLPTLAGKFNITR